MTVTGRGAIMAVWHHGGVLAFHSPWAAAWCCAGLPEVMLPCAQRGQRCSARTRAGLPVPACTNPPSALACMQIPRLHRIKGWLPPKPAPALAPHLWHDQLAVGSSASLSRSLQLGTQSVVIRFLVSTNKWSKGFISDARQIYAHQSGIAEQALPGGNHRAAVEAARLAALPTDVIGDFG